MYSRLQAPIFLRACRGGFLDQLALTHFSRNRLRKLSTCAFCTGFPGSMCTSSISRSAHQVTICRLVRFQLGNIVSGAFTPVLAKHTKNLSLVDILAVGVDRIQRNFKPMRKQVEAWKGTRLPDESAKLVIYRAFVEGELDIPKHLARRVHDLYFNPQIEEFAPRTTWSLSNAFTSAFKELDPIPQFKATAKLASFLEVATGTTN